MLLWREILINIWLSAREAVLLIPEREGNLDTN